MTKSTIILAFLGHEIKGWFVVTVQQALQGYLLEQKIRGNSDKTVIYYQSSIGRFLAHAGSGLEISELTLPVLKSYALMLRNSGLSSVTMQSYIRALRAFLTWCYNEEYLTVNLSEKFRLPKAQRKVIDILTDAEAQRLMASFNLRYLVQLRNYCICALMLDSGLRMNEVVTLELPLLHLSDGYAIVNGKGNKQRVVPLGLHTRKALLRYLNRRPACAQTDRLFLMSDLRPITENTVKQLFRKLKKRVGIPRIRAHLLRHTFATRYLENGGDIYALQQILGHTTLEMVKKYVHTTHRKTVSKFTDFSPLDRLL